MLCRQRTFHFPDFGHKALEIVLVAVEHEEAALGAGVDVALGVKIYLIGMRRRTVRILGQGIVDEGAAVEQADAVAGGQPRQSVAVANDVRHGHARQSVLVGDVVPVFLTLRVRLSAAEDGAQDAEKGSE